VFCRESLCPQDMRLEWRAKRGGDRGGGGVARVADGTGKHHPRAGAAAAGWRCRCSHLFYFEYFRVTNGSPTWSGGSLSEGQGRVLHVGSAERILRSGHLQPEKRSRAGHLQPEKRSRAGHLRPEKRSRRSSAAGDEIACRSSAAGEEVTRRSSAAGDKVTRRSPAAGEEVTRRSSAAGDEVTHGAGDEVHLQPEKKVICSWG